MSTSETKARSSITRILIPVLAGLVIAGILVEHFWPRSTLVEVVAIPRETKEAGSTPAGLALAQPTIPSPRSDASPAPVAAVAAEASPVVAEPGPAPRFDVVRVGPGGHAVIAGQAQPGAEVVVRDGTEEVARARADSRGAFVALPAEPLKPGGQELTLASRSDGRAEVEGDGSVVLVVPNAANQRPSPDVGTEAGTGPVAPQAAVAVLVPNAGAPRVLQDAPGTEPAAKQGLTLDRVDYDDKGAIRFTGGAGAGVTVRVYVDSVNAGAARADGAGRWTLVPSMDVAAGMHTLRADALGAGDRVVGRVELPFQRSAMTASEATDAGGRVVVQPGQSLWRLARAAYGRGVRYTVIYLANREQIRDPRRIYPGQTFSVPDGTAAGH